MTRDKRWAVLHEAMYPPASVGSGFKASIETRVRILSHRSITQTLGFLFSKDFGEVWCDVIFSVQRRFWACLGGYVGRVK